MSVLFLSLQRLQVVSATREEEEDNEDESHFSEGQLLPAAPRSDSDGSEVSEEIINGEEMNIDYWWSGSHSLTPDYDK